MTIERIETEALYHYSPGAKVLSLGNFGCNLDCVYCHNWKFSQFQYTPPELIHEYTAEDIISYAIKNNVKILSWTYNEPAIWFEFVIDTSRKAKEYGIKSLFKSAFFLSQEAIEELIKVTDIFAISMKAMTDEYHHQFTKGWVQPILDNTKLIHRSNLHYEISNLVVPGLTNNLESYDKIIDFILEELSADIPLHFTRCHPDYKWKVDAKTAVEDVKIGRQRALDKGLKYAYIGNVFGKDGINTFCPNCHELLIERYGLSTYTKGSLGESGQCKKCGYLTNIKEIGQADKLISL